MATDADHNPDLLNVLHWEYEHRFTEMIFHSQRYHKQSDLIYTLLAGIAAAGTAIFSDRMTEFLLHQFKGEASSFVFALHISFLVFGAVFLFYMFASILDSLVMIYLNGARLARIEQQINGIVGREALVWDSVVIPDYFYLSLFKRGGIFKPNVLIGFWVLILLLLIVFSLCYICYIFIPGFFSYYLTIMILLAAIHITQWVALHVGILRPANIETSKRIIVPGQEGSSSKADRPKSFWRLEHWVALSTFVFGWGGIAVLSLRIHAFWISPQYDFPVIFIPSVAFGDSIVLPFLNFYIVRFFRQLHTAMHLRTLSLWLQVSISTLISAFVNLYLHYVWTHDKWRAYMHVRFGVLSLAGWWHLGFSTLELSFITYFMVRWLIALKRCDTVTLEPGLMAWRVLMLFSILSIPDFLIRNFSIYHVANLSTAFLTDWPTLIPFVLAACLYGFAELAYQQKRHTLGTL
jgi:hypothetical protein